MNVEVIQLEGPLNLAERALSDANSWLLPKLATASVVIDCARVTRVTPSYANALVMTLLAAYPDAWTARRLTLRDALPYVWAEFEKAVDRYQRGIRLSTQRPQCA
jgi:hypothetical protein